MKGSCQGVEKGPAIDRSLIKEQEAAFQDEMLAVGSPEDHCWSQFYSSVT